MKIPEYIEKAIDRRTRLAYQLDDACRIVDDYIRKNGLTEEIETYDWLGGVEIYVNPEDSGKRIKEAIRNHNNQ